MKYEESKTKIIVLTGYILLIALLLAGIIGITYQIRKSLGRGTNEGESENLITVSYVLAMLYEAESIGHSVYVPNSKIDYTLLAKKDSLISVVKNGITFLKQHNDDEYFVQKFDSVEILLAQKADNELKIIHLVDSITKLPMQRREITTVLSQKELDNLTGILKKRDMLLKDSIFVITQAKSFGQKFGDLFRQHTHDTVHVKNIQVSDTLENILPVNFTLDTISQYVTDFMFQRSSKMLRMTVRLSARQMELLNINETLFNKINMILSSLEERNLRIKEQRTEERNTALLRSNCIGYFVALAALIIAVLFVFITMRLINRQRNSRQKLEMSNKKIGELLKIREWLMLSVSHDIKAPISSILGYADLIEKNNLFENEKNHIANLKNSSLQVLELVNNLINLHKIEQGKLSAKYSEISPYNITKEVFTRFQPVAQAKNLKFILQNNLPENIICQSDFVFINNILNNLIFNALKFTKKGKIEFLSELKQNGNTSEVIFSIRDSGIGMAPEDLEKLFTEFERTQSPEIHHIEGSGLGLSISKKLAELLNGKISVVSAKGKGSTFTLCIPANNVKTQEKSVQNIKNQKSVKRKLLFIDDDLLLLKVYEEMAKKLDCIPYTASKLEDIINILNNNKIEILFCDIKMPEMDGFSLIENIRKKTENPPIFVAVSASASYSKSELKKNGFAEFLQKPFSISDLDSIITKLSDEKTDETHFDFTSLTNYAIGDKESATMIIRTFISENVNIVHQIEQAIMQGDSILLNDLVHKILPRMQMINNQEIITILHALKRGEIETLQKHNLMKLVEKINAKAQEFIDKTLN